MEKVTLEITKVNGKYTVNGKVLIELNPVEKKFLNDFFVQFKIKHRIKDPVFDKPINS